MIPIHHWPNHEIALITKFFEYSHARLPIVVSDVRTMAATVRATGQGEVFRARDTADFVRAVRAVLADPERYRAVYDAPDSPLAGWTWEAQADRLDALYRAAAPGTEASADEHPRRQRRGAGLQHDAVPDRVPGLAGRADHRRRTGCRSSRWTTARPTAAAPSWTGSPPATPAWSPSSTSPTRAARPAPATGRWTWPPAGTSSSSAPTTSSARRPLQRLVTAADTYGSDVVLGRVVGVHSRHIYQDIFARTEPDLDLFDSPLPRSLANTKLFRRELLEPHGIRYREDMPIGSDLPFTLEACYRAAADLGAGRLRLLLRRTPVQRHQHHLSEPARAAAARRSRRCSRSWPS